MKNLGEIFKLPKWVKISLVALSVVAIALLVATFALQKWADLQVESANLSFSKIDKAKSAELAGNSNLGSDSQIYAYEARVYFPRLDFLLRSRTISHIDLEKIAWESSVDSSAIQSVESQKRRLLFTTTQQLNLDSGANLGTMSYKMDFSPLSKAIIKYYVALMILFTLTLIFYNIFKNEVHRFFAFLKSESLPQALWQGYKNINPLYRHTFWIVFIACNIVFGFDSAQFLWGRESWWSSFDKVGGNWAVAQGRWSQNALYLLFTQDLILPFLNNFVAFFAFSVASILLCAYLNITRKVWIWAIIGLTLTLSPFTLARMYFSYQVAGLFIAVAIGILGFILAKKAGEYSLAYMGGGGSNTSQLAQLNANPRFTRQNLKPYFLCLISACCIHFGIASYQPFIDTALILLCGGIIAIIFDNNGDIKTSLYKSHFLIISVALAGISYKIALDILKKLGTVSESYNNQMIPLSEMLERIILATKMAFQALFAYNVDFMPPFIAVLFGALAVIFIALLFSTKLDFRAKVSVCVVLFGAIVASQTHIILSKNISTGIITDYYGVLFLRVLIVALVFKAVGQMIKTQILWRNLVFGLSCVIIWACVIQSLDAQKVLKLTMERDFHYLNRIVARIESNENFSYEKKYCGVLFGKPQNAFREGFNTDILPIWEMEQVFRYTMSKNVFEGCKMYSDLMQDFVDNNHKENKAFNTLISRLHKAGILDKLQPYPNENSIVVFEDIIVFVASKGNLDKIKQMTKTLDNKGALQ